MEKNFYNLYKKYKIKYLNLKQQIGGSSIGEEKISPNQRILNDVSGKLFIPCEINHFTKYLYVLKERADILDNFEDIKSLIEKVSCKFTGGFMQDHHILLKDQSNIDYGFKVCPMDICSKNPFNKNLKILDFISRERNGNYYGGNYLSAPNNKIFTMNNTYLHDNLKIYLEQPVIQLKCSFTFNDERHIDELMAFMPYGERNYKVWIYDISNIYVDNFEVPDISSTIKKYDELKKFIKAKDLIIKSKKGFGRATKELDVSNIFHDSNLSDLDILKNNNLTKFLSDIRLICVNLSEMETKLLVFYYSLPNPKPDKSELAELLQREVDNIKENLISERLVNLNLISNELFDGNYNLHLDKFVSFPIDLKIDHILDNNFILTNIPIFNRLLIETDDVRRCIYSIGTNIDPRVRSILNIEEPKIASFINNKLFQFSNVNTSEFNKSNGAVGGNIHCLVKNQYR